MEQRDLGTVKSLLRAAIGRDGYAAIRRLGGLTNRTYHVTMPEGDEYAVRVPGDGTEEMIVRSDEKVSTELACRLGIDAELLYFGPEGTKVTRYLPAAETMSPEAMRRPEHIRQAAELLRTLHTCGEDTGVPFEVFEMAATYERVIRENHVPLYDDYEAVKAQVMAIKEALEAGHERKLVPCHNDPLCENWIVSQGRMYLVDWEYAGMNLGMWDLADVSIEATYDEAQDALLLDAYFGRPVTAYEKQSFLANKLYLDYLWTLWGLTRVPFDGEPMVQYALERYVRLKGNLQAYENISKED